MWADLQPVGRVASGGYRRFAWTREDHTLREWFAGECAARGLDLVEDRMGNQWAWWGNPDATPGVVAGSHLDSVPDGGAYDGPLGVVSALAAVDALRDSGFQPSRPIGVVNFGDEEGARFGVACAGSRVITGELDADRALGLTDADGVTMGEALKRAGRPASIGTDEDAVRRIGSFVELHVEQGRAMADADRYDQDHAAVAIGTDIWPHGRWRLDFVGIANHAGTTRLEDRHDAMLACATAVAEARGLAEKHGCVATIGKLRVEPNGVNAIPSHVTAWLDARGAEEAAVLAMVEELSEGAAAEVNRESWTPTTAFDTSLADRLHNILGDVPMLGTGAGHDAGILSNAGVSTAMLFVRNPTGVSHSPEEFAEQADCHVGVRALTAVLQDLAG
ncbi:allantoate amidohydrolase [Allobranchiibius sp. GilTou73]|nr:allantoate amidohydrolase [Allobranchiibius sp. GilTou73]UIJ36506.1 allantoate amidohydrolase [Allobranchiibius sp. GilTou73]